GLEDVFVLQCYGCQIHIALRLPPRASPAQNERVRRAPLFPSPPLKFRLVVFRRRITQAEVTDEVPRIGNLQDGVHALWIQNGEPSHADTLRACREPHHADRGYNRVFRRLRHGSASKSMSKRAVAIGEDRELAWRRIEPGEFEFGVALGQLTRIGVARARVASCEFVEHCAAQARILHDYKTPGLTEPNRRRKTGGLDQALERAAGKGIRAKVADVATPDKQVAQAQPK